MSDQTIATVLPRAPAKAWAAGALALAVFVVDTITPLDVAVAVLYVVVILLAAGALSRRGLLLVVLACLGLIVASYAVTHAFSDEHALARGFMSLTATAITGWLALRNQQTTEVLREQANLLDLSHDAIFVRDMHDVIRFWSRGAEQVYGWRRHEAVGLRTTHDLLQTRFPAPLEAINADLLRYGRWEGELEHTKRDGAVITSSSRWALQRDDRGLPVAVLETNTDITERRRSQEALQKAQAELAHVTRVTTLGELTASIAHEVNQPLAAIVTNGEACLRWLGRAVPDIDEARSAVERMIDDGRRASAVIARMRAFTRKTAPQAAPLGINDVVEDVIPLIRRELDQNRIRLVLDLGEGLPSVTGDRIQLQQVVINLLVNAIQAMTAVAGRPRVLEVRSRMDGADRVLLEISDSGIGIAADETDRLFDPFFTTKPGGMGMGLSICRSIVETHEGRIALQPADPGPGVTVRVTLPAPRA